MAHPPCPEKPAPMLSFSGSVLDLCPSQGDSGIRTDNHSDQLRPGIHRPPQRYGPVESRLHGARYQDDQLGVYPTHSTIGGP
jgi:hypothetical protein